MLNNVLVVDNFDSFTYNLVDFFRLQGCRVTVFRNTVDPEVLAKEDFDLLVLSPGPSVPAKAGNLMAIIGRFYQTKPILGVCLGHQALVEFFGGSLHNIAPVHGKAEAINHDGRGMFTGIENPCHVARYHSWAADRMPAELEITATSADGTVMALRHKRLPIEGIQFHPESVLSMRDDVGMRLLKNAVSGRLSAGNRVYHQLSSLLQNGGELPLGIFKQFLLAVEEGQLSDEQKQILLVSLSHRLRNAAELRRFTEALLAMAQAAPDIELDAVDICGTGGSGLPRINTSTLATLLLAHAGLPVAKHGNRAAAGRFGSFNLLEALGLPITYQPETAARTLYESNLAFLFAPDIHPVFRHFAAVRSKIGVPTVFNILGPLVNPLQPRRQFIGTAFAELMDVIFETGILLGKTHFIVVRGHDGLDEISLSAPTRVLEYRDGKRYDYDIQPEDFGLETIPFERLSAHPNDSLSIARDIIQGHPKTDHYRLVAANAAFVYAKFVEEMPLPEAYELMVRRLREGAMGEQLARYREAVSAEEWLGVSLRP
ncbi:MAG: anthranilate phosphoribosyltransferase [Saprospiraceae bacterium]|nr:anthranilate phosphoribosyltransferase [Saprospiraceae bacterium]